MLRGNLPACALRKAKVILPKGRCADESKKVRAEYRIDLKPTRPMDETVKSILSFEIIQIGVVCVGLHGNRLDAFESYVQPKPRFACELSRDAKRAWSPPPPSSNARLLEID